MLTTRNPRRIVTLLIYCLCLLLTLTSCSTESQYAKANKLMAEGKYAEAVEKFEALGSFNDAPLLTMYAKAAMAGENGQFDACLQAFENLGEFKDSKMMVEYYTARAYEAKGLSAQTPLQQAEQRSWNELLAAAEIYGNQLLFRDSENRQQTCYQAAYDMAEELASNKLFDAASAAHLALASYQVADSESLVIYYSACADEAQGQYAVAAQTFEQ